MKPILIASCSNRKANINSVKISVSQLKKGSYDRVTRDWHALVTNSKIRCPADKLYCGRGAQEVSRASTAIGADLWFVSAGLGLIKGSQLIPDYDLTISKGSAAYIGSKINTGNFSPEEWWGALGRRKAGDELASIVKNNCSETVMLAMPTAYFNMISASLDTLALDDLSHIRIIGPNAAEINPRYLPFLMPYNERLSGRNSPLRGTRSDFPQRAVHHFSKYILAKKPRADKKRHSNMVTANLSLMEFPVIITRKRVSDVEILGLISKNWLSCEGRSTMSLRMLRDKDMVACEQKRFTRIFNQVKLKLSN